MSRPPNLFVNVTCVIDRHETLKATESPARKASTMYRLTSLFFTPGCGGTAVTTVTWRDGTETTTEEIHQPMQQSDLFILADIFGMMASIDLNECPDIS